MLKPVLSYLRFEHIDKNPSVFWMLEENKDFFSGQTRPLYLGFFPPIFLEARFLKKVDANPFIKCKFWSPSFFSSHTASAADERH